MKHQRILSPLCGTYNTSVRGKNALGRQEVQAEHWLIHIPQDWTSFCSSGSSGYRRSSSLRMFLSANLRMSGDSWSTTLSDRLPITSFGQLVPAPSPLHEQLASNYTLHFNLLWDALDGHILRTRMPWLLTNLVQERNLNSKNKQTFKGFDHGIM